MCAFQGHKVVSDEVRHRDNPVIAYKVLKEGSDGVFFSVCRYTKWIGGRMYARGQMQPNGYGRGIYAWATAHTARKNVRTSSYKCVVKVALYGRVIRYAPLQIRGWGVWDYQPAGYMAERAKILEVID